MLRDNLEYRMFRRCNKDFRDVVRKMGDVVLTPHIVIAGAGVDGSAVLQGPAARDGSAVLPPGANRTRRTGGGRKSTAERQEELMVANVNAERQSINDSGLARALQGDDAQRQPAPAQRQPTASPVTAPQDPSDAQLHVPVATAAT